MFSGWRELRLSVAGTYAWDKDACVAVMMLCEVASWYKKQNMTLWDAMLSMYESTDITRGRPGDHDLKGNGWSRADSADDVGSPGKSAERTGRKESAGPAGLSEGSARLNRDTAPTGLPPQCALL